MGDRNKEKTQSKIGSDEIHSYGDLFECPACASDHTDVPLRGIGDGSRFLFYICPETKKDVVWDQKTDKLSVEFVWRSTYLQGPR